MKTLNLKVAPDGNYILCDPKAKGEQIVLITEIPDHIPAADVILAANASVDVSWLFGPARETIAFTELGPGRMIGHPNGVGVRI